MGRRALVLVCVGLLVGGCTSDPEPEPDAAPRPAVSPTTTPAPTVKLAAVGDMACPISNPAFNEGRGTSTVCRAKDVSDLVVRGDYDAFLSLGDHQYLEGDLADFKKSYDLSFGRVLDITYPIPGNHDYGTPGANGYFDYFGKRAHPPHGYYSFDLGSWHVIALNSNCGSVEGKPNKNDCAPGSRQERWLKRDLAANRTECTLAFWHHPRFTSSNEKEVTETPEGWHRTFWKDLYEAGAEIILNGHAHHYERIAPQTPGGRLDEAKGLHQFIVGGGGKDVDPFGEIVHNSRKHADAFGVLSLKLMDGSFSWRFVPVKHQEHEDFRDQGSADCH